MRLVMGWSNRARMARMTPKTALLEIAARTSALVQVHQF
jgi:hypothetical protein